MAGQAIWNFLETLPRADYDAEAGRLFAMFSISAISDEQAKFRQFTNNRMWVNIERLIGAAGTRADRARAVDREPNFVRQINTIAMVPSAADIRMFLGLLMAFRESARMSALLRSIRSSFFQGGLDGLETQQRTLRAGGWLPSDVTFASGPLVGDAAVPGTQILLPYGARVGFAARKVRDVIAEVKSANPRWSGGFAEAQAVYQNFLISLAAAAQGGESAVRWCPHASGNEQHCGIITVVEYMALVDASTSTLSKIWDFVWPLPRGRNLPFRIQRIRAAIHLAVSGTALHNLYRSHLSGRSP